MCFLIISYLFIVCFLTLELKFHDSKNIFVCLFTAICLAPIGHTVGAY